MKAIKNESCKDLVDHVLWALVWLFPVISFLISFWHTGTTEVLLDYVDQHFAWSFIKDIFDNVWLSAFGSTPALSGYISYLTMVEIAHCFFDAMVFIPRFAHDLIDKCTHWLGGRHG